MIKFLFVLLSFSFVPLNLKAESAETNTEAGFTYDARMASDFCCDRAHKSESAHDLSDRESRRIVDKTLYSPRFKPSPPEPARGKR